MTIERTLRGIAGFFILVSLGLGFFLHQPWWYLWTAIIGVNLLQSSFTNRCPMMSILKMCGLK